MLFLLSIVVFIFTFSTSPAAQDRHSHDEIFAVTGKIDADFESGKIDRAFALKQKAYLLLDRSRMDLRYRPEEATLFKCLTPVAMMLESARQKGFLDSETEALLNSADQPDQTPETKAVYLSPSGRFEFTYEITGSDAIPAADANGNSIPDYVEWSAFAADSSWNYMVTRMGYVNPIVSNMTYKMTFKDFQYYGVTYTSGPTTRIEIHRNFSGFPGNTHPAGQQRGALYATIGHELKHAIQFVYEGWSKDSEKYLEMDATMYEETIFDDVNDYYNYLGANASIFRTPSGSVYAGSYYHATWALFFYQKYGPTFWRTVWQRIGNTESTFLINLRDAATAAGGNVLADIVENQLFHAATGDTVVNPTTARTLKNFGFEERSKYPVSTASLVIGASNPLSSPITINGLAARHFVVRPDAGDTGLILAAFSYTKSTAGMGVVVEKKDRTSASYILLPQSGSSLVQLQLNERWEDVRKVVFVLANNDLSTTSATGTSFQNQVRWEISKRQLNVNLPQLTVTPESIPRLTSELGLESASASYTLSATNLTDDLKLVASAGFELSLTNARTSFSSTLILPPVNDALPATTIFVRLSKSASLTTTSGTLLHEFQGQEVRQIILSSTVSLPVSNLFQNYPNPFRTSTTLAFALNARSSVQLVLYDLTGRKIYTVFDRELSAGHHRVEIPTSKLGSGIYFCQLLLPGETKIIKLTKVN